MRPAFVITCNGFTGTLREWAKRSGLNLDTLKSRVNRGMPLAKALMMPTRQYEPPRRKRLTKLLCYRGERATIAQWAARAGLTEMCLRYRLYRGRTLEEALTEPPHKMPARLQQTVSIKAIHVVSQCFFCKRPLTELKFRKGIFGGVPICGAPDCVQEGRPHPWLDPTHHFEQDIAEVA